MEGGRRAKEQIAIYRWLLTLLDSVKCNKGINGSIKITDKLNTVFKSVLSITVLLIYYKNLEQLTEYSILLLCQIYNICYVKAEFHQNALPDKQQHIFSQTEKEWSQKRSCKNKLRRKSNNATECKLPLPVDIYNHVQYGR